MTNFGFRPLPKPCAKASVTGGAEGGVLCEKTINRLVVFYRNTEALSEGERYDTQDDV